MVRSKSVSASNVVNKDFFIVPMHELVETRGKKLKLVKKTFYIRKNRLYILLREVIAEKQNWKKVVDIIKAIVKTPKFVVGR